MHCTVDGIASKKSTGENARSAARSFCARPVFHVRVALVARRENRGARTRNHAVIVFTPTRVLRQMQHVNARTLAPIKQTNDRGRAVARGEDAADLSKPIERGRT